MLYLALHTCYDILNRYGEVYGVSIRVFVNYFTLIISQVMGSKEAKTPWKEKIMLLKQACHVPFYVSCLFDSVYQQQAKFKVQQL